MILRLTHLPDKLRGPSDDAYHGKVPKRARFLHPDAARSILLLVDEHPWLTFTDIFRSPESSLAARKTKRGVQPPGYSAHNFGLAVDLDVGACLRGGGLSYPVLTDLMAAAGWHCHRRDLDSTAMESWHFNFFGAESDRLLASADAQQPRTWSWPAERRIVELYGAAFDYDNRGLQEQLARLWLYRGQEDGVIGPITREAVSAFQRAWGLDDDGEAGPRTRRVLALVAAQLEIK